MKFATTTVAVTAVFLPSVMANFDIYWFKSTGIGSSANSWSLFNSPPSCDEADSATAWEDRSDVSGNKHGIRCEGENCAVEGSPSGIEVLEMNFGERGGATAHWTLYKDRNYDLVDTDGKKQGNCFPYPGDVVECDVVPAGTFTGYRKFRCLIESWSADDFN